MESDLRLKKSLLLLHCHKDTVCEAQKRFVVRGFAAALERKKRETPPVPSLFDGEAEARLMALACSAPPEGRARSFVATAVLTGGGTEHRPALHGQHRPLSVLKKTND